MNAPTIRTAAQQTVEASEGRPLDEVLRGLYAAGLSQVAIAERLGVSRHSVMRWMRSLGLSTRHPRDRRAA